MEPNAKRTDGEVSAPGNSEREIAELRRKLAQRERQFVELQQSSGKKSKALKKELARITNSWSWKLTRPLRVGAFVADLLRRRREGGAAEPAATASPPVVPAAKKGGSRPAAPATRPLPKDFDPAMYLQLNPDVAAAGLDPAQHFLRNGRKEGRLYALPAVDMVGERDFQVGRDTVLLVTHEATRTGAPMVSYNLAGQLARRHNVLVLLLGDGPLADQKWAPGVALARAYQLRKSPGAAHLVVGFLCERFQFRFALANSIETGMVLEALRERHVPSLMLIHEYASCYARPPEAFRAATSWADGVVFSADSTRDNALDECPALRGRPVHVIPQGRCLVPPGEELGRERLEAERARIFRRMRPRGAPAGAVVVLGAGSVHLRKGVDLFIQCATRVARAPGGENYRFVWIGTIHDGDKNLGYYLFVKDQLRRAGLEDRVVFIDNTPAIETAYEAADLLLITSRLDPLPNVAIDAMAHGMPVICFDKTTGIADFLKESGLKDRCVAGYLDADDMAGKVRALGASPDLRKQTGELCRTAAASYFDLPKYVARLEELARAVPDRARREETDAHTILASGAFRPDFANPPHLAGQPLESAVGAYVRSWANGVFRRKPFPGFHPGVYRERHGLAEADADPLADFLRAGRPEGPWLVPVVSPETINAANLPDNPQVALHLHVFYPDVLPEILGRLARNRIRPDLFVSIAHEAARADVAARLQDYAGTVAEIRTVPNRGRDVGPLLTAFGPQLVSDYEFIGHLHTKKSLYAKTSVVNAWNVFLLDNLLGTEVTAMADGILGRMNADPALGMAFPDDPNVMGWEPFGAFAGHGPNWEHALALAARAGLDRLPESFTFPIGNMFWARGRALEPLVRLHLDWEDYPEEPVPIDGTLLHAIERLLPLTLSLNGLRVAVTNIRGLTR